MELLFQLYGDAVLESIFSEEETIRTWLRVEAELAKALGDAGVVPAVHATAIAEACQMRNVDKQRLWEETRVVGYPILPLVRMICRALPSDAAAFVHWGATTQDIMDSALVLQVSAAARRVLVLVDIFGNVIADLVEEHRGTLIAARTHGQQAVPTTFGAKCAGVLDQLRRDCERLVKSADAVQVISLFGAGGTSAALGSAATKVRSALAARLQLADTGVPWHTSRDRFVEVALDALLAAQTAVRFARDVVDLSRTEIGELREADGDYRGASSTMPQKANPVSAEAVIGLGVAGAAMSCGLLRGMEVQQERAAGEWQVEWQAIPFVLRSVAGCVSMVGELAKELRVFPERMRENLRLDHELVLAEAYMVRLARVLGRDEAHELVYRAARQSRSRHLPLPDVLTELLSEDMLAATGGLPIEPEQYLGDVDAVCDRALGLWRSKTGGSTAWV